MELSDGGHGGDALAPELRELFPLGRVDVDETVHIADAETLDVVLGLGLPLGSEAGGS